jgi:TPP-dependent pyruvate/acetoin dehydrogenase alpha subunit
MRCIDECKKGNDKEGNDKEDACACDDSDTDSVASLTEAELDQLIRDASQKVLKVADKPTKAKKKKVEKVIEDVVEATTNTEKRVRKPPQKFKASKKK